MRNEATEAASVSLNSAEPKESAWMAVISLTMGVFGLLTAEYLPASLLTPMAADLGVTEALAGQAVTVTAVVALFAGLMVPRLTRNYDRRTVLLGFTVLMIASNLLVALSSSLAVLLVMRILLGIALGGFWSMAAAVAAHECGHALQHAQAYAPLTMRSKLVPVVSFASQWMTWLLLAGILLLNSFPQLLLAGIILFAMTTLFSFVTLPVEINASKRALVWLSASGITNSRNHAQAEDALRSAAYTYVVAALSSLATLIYYIMIFLGRRD